MNKIKPFVWLTEVSGANEDAKISGDTKVDTRSSSPSETKYSNAFQITIPGVSIICGMTESGKTSLAMNLLIANALMFHMLIILSPTAHLQSVFNNVVKANNLVSEPEAMIERINEVIDDQKRLIAREKAMGLTIENGPRRKVMFLVDDFIGTLKMSNSNIFNQLATSSRQYGISMLILTQDLMKVGTTVRDNARELYVTGIKSHNCDEVHRLQSWFTKVKETTEFVKNNARDYRVVRFKIGRAHV